MLHTEPNSLHRLGLITALSLLLAACASNPFVASDSEPAEAPTAVVGEDGKRVATPNPYLTGAGGASKVPEAAQQGLNRARQYFEQQELTAAETELQQVVAQWPQLSGAWLNLAKVQLKLEQPESAKASLQQAVVANENNVFAWNSLGALLRDQGKFEEARAAYASALAKWPDFTAAHRNLGILYDLYLHQPEQALHHYREARALEVEEDRKLLGWIMDLERRL